MTKIPFSICFEDTHLIVLVKPAGLLSQGDHSSDLNLVDSLREYLGRNYVGLVHRLDRNTSGLMVVAKRSKAARRLTESLQEGRICRVYLSWVWGKIETDVNWKHQLLKDSNTNEVQVVSAGGKFSELSGTPLDYGKIEEKEITLMQFQLETGRSHQIRVQGAFEGFPVVGDLKYGKSSGGLDRLALHSSSIEFPHPMSNEVMNFEDPLPPELLRLKTKAD